MRNERTLDLPLGNCFPLPASARDLAPGQMPEAWTSTPVATPCLDTPIPARFP
jgi:hypothetical protein